MHMKSLQTDILLGITWASQPLGLMARTSDLEFQRLPARVPPRIESEVGVGPAEDLCRTEQKLLTRDYIPASLAMVGLARLA